MSDRIDRRIGPRIRKLRRERALSQSDVAAPLFSAAYLSLIESGQRTPSPKALKHIARKLGLEVDEILTGRPHGTEARLELTLQEARVKAQTGRRDEADELLNGVVREAGRFSLPRLHARAVTLLGGLAEQAGEMNRARELFDRALDLMRDDPLHLRFEAVVGVARCMHHDGDTRMAVHYLENYLLDLKTRRMEDPTARMRVLSVLVSYYRALGLPARATEAAEDALKLAPEVDDPEQIACMSMNVARALYADGRHDDALDALRRAEVVFQTLHWPLATARTRINKGIVQVDKGNLEAAKESFEGALELLSDMPHERVTRGELLNELARVRRLLGDTTRASELLKEARSHLGKADLAERAFNAREMGLLLADDDPTGAEKELRRAVKDYLAASARREAASTLLELGRILEQQNRLADAARAFEEGLELSSAG